MDDKTRFDDRDNFKELSKSFENLTTSNDENVSAKIDVHERDSFKDLTSSSIKKGPLCLFVLGMAGSGKTTFVQKLTSCLTDKKLRVYAINLDPAVFGKLPYPCKVDIRDTVNYTEVMRSYQLGPNGAIMTSLNLFATQVNQLISLLEKRCTSSNEIVLIDTPGQIEVFTWSASGTIFLESFASVFPTAIVFIGDVTKMSESPITFMSNMLYACSILYKSRVPLTIVLNKNDVIYHQEIVNWMTDFESFQEALDNEQSYSGNLTRSLSLALEEFYSKIKAVGFSSISGDGLENLLNALEDAKREYFEVYMPMYIKLKEEKQRQEKQRENEKISKAKLDILKDRIQEFESERPVVSVFPVEDETETQDNEQDDLINEKLNDESFQRFLSKQKSH